MVECGDGWDVMYSMENATVNWFALWLDTVVVVQCAADLRCELSLIDYDIVGGPFVLRSGV